ncbi:SAM-dependent methyltransferase [Amycolatopsis alkalitolerans]|uniref:Class I SAM-dependent methyltransferase n=1 Tax=Amycolatopsis alkalitolerans TaxID=2547244 RepID=A0A5C4LS25_9PSEU|nr:cyclopropane-fatty-acyl-phospholipid synthase family protein [Amycolatopsis alkalitolerans]TNC20584.1 class I SAM-dependent methyltransferase [Amycolatopsis alkalitolerans]
MSPAAPLLAGLVSRIIGGDLPVRLRTWDGSTAGPDTGPTVQLRSRRALRYLLWAPGELGLARAYVSGALDVDGDLTEGLRRVWASFDTRARARPRLGPRAWARIVATAARLGVLGLPPRPPAGEARPSRRPHTQARDRAVISYHYDLGNDFYQLILDPTMAYSCAYFRDPADDLATAQRAKLDLVCRKLRLGPGMRLLDVGCGWGSLLLHAAERYGVEATGVTLSAQQAEHIRGEITRRDLSGVARVCHQDYRDLSGEPFDAIVSLEMGEHVGARNYSGYAATLHRMLKPGAPLLLQQMSRDATAPGGGAFIESYVAPDMTMVPIGMTLGLLENAGFEIRGVEALREHYVCTVRAWAERLEKHAEEITRIAGATQLRVWRLYLAGGALAFEENRMGVNQILAKRAA